VCDGDPHGSIDPQPFVDDDGTPYLLWKSEGWPGVAPTRIWAQPLAPDGLSFAPGSAQVELLRTTDRWEGYIVENPSMVRYRGHLYLFYSGNDWRSPNYAVGYADCAGPLGPCTKSALNPVLASRGDRLGPGGSNAFLDAQGNLRLAYHWWNAPYTDYPEFPACEASRTCTTQGQRRLGIDQVFPTVDGLQVGGSPPPFNGDAAVSITTTRTGAGYWIAGAAGNVSARGDAPKKGAPTDTGSAIRGMAPTASGQGYWMTGSNGAVFAYGDAPSLGGVDHLPLTLPVVGMAATPTGKGYWLVASDGGIFSFGDARFMGSTGNIRLNQPIVGMAATASGQGYWLVASDGGIFSFGDARFMGSTGNIRLNQPIVGMARNTAGTGYWMVATDGGVFSFGTAHFFGSTGDIRLNQPIAGMAPTPSDGGYWMVARDGGIFSFGNAPFQGAA
jgi:hypothetical protein